jgi:carboxylate-amine ligase
VTIKFIASSAHTIGIEMEVQLLDRETLSLTPASSDIIDALKGLGGSVKHELLMSNLEINTDICFSVKEAGRDLYKKFDLVSKEASKHNTLLCCAGTHPFSLWRNQIMTEDARYMRLLGNLQIIARRFNIFGLHVHVGVGGGERCIYIMNRMLFYLPHLLAISTNSPFWEGYNTGLKSYRTKVFENLPIAGLPFYFEHWADYTHLVENYIATGTIETIRELWWDIRPHPDFGTVEVRVCDIPATVKEALALAALIQALVKKFEDEYLKGVPFKRPHSAIIRENKWRACRYGIEGEFITQDGGSTVKARDAIEELVDILDKEAEALGSSKYLALVRDILKHGDGSARQLKVWKDKGDLKEVVRDLCTRLEQDIRSMGKR